MVAQVCEYTKNHWNVHFKLLNYMVYQLYLNKAIFPKASGAAGRINFVFIQNIFLSLFSVSLPGMLSHLGESSVSLQYLLLLPYSFH